ncbi:YnbE family lipoprotein [Pseudomaricurvus alkylphenolicus]|uniref:YnbE family lipoprotein n=1 Tax=Pseudomaricurvus alkylphenolicus TaxID=1306991 RepID=UPI00141F824D|nr:YnbE family lipoprotein [Pseudomaricurvus alkylphenolicus]NIB41629.1 YnbE family lipoprotein [Pseudomaricurvus alkylphenolicus]
MKPMINTLPGLWRLIPLALVATLWGCTPTVQVQAPEKPITINLNIKIEHEIRVKVDKELDELFSEDSELF